MNKSIALCKSRKSYSLILGLLCLYSSQSVFAESALQKSLLELKKAIQESVQKSSGGVNQSTKTETLKQNGNVEGIFDVPVKQKQKIELYWKTKTELFNAIAENKIPKLSFDTDSETKLKVAESIATILMVDYKTPLYVNDISDTFCGLEFTNSVPRLIGLITESKFMKLGDTPPIFLGNPDVEYNNSEGRRLLFNLKNACTMANGSKAVYPFVNSLSMLLKEYSDLTEVHVEKMRLEKIEFYKVTEEKARVAEVEKDFADSEARILENQASEKLRRDRQFQNEFNRKEEARKAQCLSSIEYARFVSATAVQENLSRVKSAKDTILKEKEIGKVSGYEDAGKLNELGRMQIFAQDSSNSAYKDYRKYGGKATSPNGIIAGKNPCL